MPIITVFSQSVFFNEQFNQLNRWDHISLPLAKGDTRYDIIDSEDMTYLKAITDNSASSLIYKEDFDVYEYPVVEWKWKVENVFSRGDGTKKSGDDYPIRVYINFRYVKDRADTSLRFRYNFVKKFYGLDIPDSSLNYVWANKYHEKRIFPNIFDPERSKIIVLQAGKEELNMWKTESINIVEDYRLAYGEDPPRIAYLSLMADSDNTGEKAIAYIDYIIVKKDE